MKSILQQPRFPARAAGFFLLVCALPVAADVTLPRVLGDHMVFQRGMPVPVWGAAEPGEKITVTFLAQEKTTTAGADGRWSVKLDPLGASAEPATLTVAGNNTLTCRDILVGEVWVGSGQSNIDTPVNAYADKDPVLQAAQNRSHPCIRLYHSRRGNGWRKAEQRYVIGATSAQLFYFAVLLEQELGVPVGVMEGAVAGSAAAPFLPGEAFKADRDMQAKLEKWDADNPLEPRLRKYGEDFAKWREDVTAAMAPETPDFDNLPKAVRDKHRRPAEPVRAADMTTGKAFDANIRPMVPYAIRGVLWDQGEAGPGFTRGHKITQPQTMSVLISSWRALWGQGDFPWLYVQKPSGGGCAFDPGNPVNRGAKPFEPLPAKVPPGDYRSHLRREAYDITAQNTNTFLVITSDLDMGVHPANKSGYATRDALVALGAVYGRAVEYYGPQYKSHAVEGNKLRIFFTHIGKGLAVPDGQTPRGFCIAGADRQFKWADAEIDGDTVLLSHPGIPEPAAARYAWTWPCAWANLFNRDGLPGLGFRTDNW